VIDRTVASAEAAVADVADGATVMIGARRVRKIICSFPRQVDSHHFDALYRAGEIELELVPRGNLATSPH